MLPQITVLSVGVHKPKQTTGVRETGCVEVDGWGGHPSVYSPDFTTAVLFLNADFRYNVCISHCLFFLFQYIWISVKSTFAV